MAEHSCETIGFFSRVDGEVVDPIFTTLNLEEIKKINRDRVPLDISQQKPIANNKDKIGNLLNFLEDKHVFDKPLKGNEHNVVCSAKALFILLFKNKFDRDAKEFKFYKHFDDKTTVIEECHTGQPGSLNDEYQLYTDSGQIAEVLLSLLPDGTMPEEHSANTLCIVVKHRFVCDNGMIINLYLSKGIHSVLKKDQEMIPVHMKYSSYHAVSTKPMFEKCRWKRLVYHYLVGALCSFIALPARNDENVVEKVFVIDDLSAVVAAAVVYDMGVWLPHVLQTIVGLSAGTVNKSGYVFSRGRAYQDVLISDEEGKLIKSIGAISTIGGYVPQHQYEPKDHELVIVGTNKRAIPYSHHLYNADFVSLQHFRDGIFADLLTKPKYIEFYGTADEYEELQDHMDADQLAILSFVESRY